MCGQLMFKLMCKFWDFTTHKAYYVNARQRDSWTTNILMVGLYSCILYLFTSVICRVLFMFKPNYQNRPAFHKFVIISTLDHLREFYTEINKKKFWNMPIVRKFFDQSLFVFTVFSFYRLKLSSQIRVRILLYTILYPVPLPKSNCFSLEFPWAAPARSLLC